MACFVNFCRRGDTWTQRCESLSAQPAPPIAGYKESLCQELQGTFIGER